MKRTFVRKRIKAAAMIHLSGNWLKAFVIKAVELILASFIISRIPFALPTQEEIMAAGGDLNRTLLLFFPQGVTDRLLALIGVVAILYLIVIAPLKVGKCRFFLTVAKGEKGKLAEVFSVYTDIKCVFSAVWLKILTTALLIFWAFVFSLISTAVLLFGVYANSQLIVNASAILAPCASVFAVLWCMRYTFAEYILAEGECGAFMALRRSIALTRNRKFECVALRASYALWILASVPFVPVKLVYSALYGTVCAKYLLYFRADKKKRPEENPSA